MRLNFISLLIQIVVLFVVTNNVAPSDASALNINGENNPMNSFFRRVRRSISSEDAKVDAEKLPFEDRVKRGEPLTGQALEDECKSRKAGQVCPKQCEDLGHCSGSNKEGPSGRCRDPPGKCCCTEFQQWCCSP